MPLKSPRPDAPRSVTRTLQSVRVTSDKVTSAARLTDLMSGLAMPRHSR